MAKSYREPAKTQTHGGPVQNNTSGVKTKEGSYHEKNTEFKQNWKKKSAYKLRFGVDSLSLF